MGCDIHEGTITAKSPEEAQTEYAKVAPVSTYFGFTPINVQQKKSTIAQDAPKFNTIKEAEDWVARNCKKWQPALLAKYDDETYVYGVALPT